LSAFLIRSAEFLGDLRMRIIYLFMCTWAALASTIDAEEYRGIFWNLESGDSSATLIASQMVAKGNIDFWGLSEVANQATLNTLEAALEAANPGVDYIAKLSEEGASDRLAILYRSDRLTSVDYGGTATVDDIGQKFFEVDSINVGGTLRPGLGIQLRGTDGSQVVVLVNHWKCCGGPASEAKRKQQAIQMNAFAILTPGIPIIAGGDFNIPINNGGRTTEAFLELAGIWEYKETQGDVGSHQGGSILDAVFVTNRVSGWDSSAQVLEREGNTPANSGTFNDNGSQTDHRPLLFVVKSDTEERVEALRESIAELEQTLGRLKAELMQLEQMN
jgi:hypothetical protein